MTKNKIRLKPRHLVRLDLYIQAKRLEISNPDYIMGYNDCMREGEVKIFERIRQGIFSNDTSFKIEITDGLEDICELCPKKEELSCESEEAKRQDHVIAGVYGAEIGKEYTPKELLKLVLSYHANAQKIYNVELTKSKEFKIPIIDDSNASLCDHVNNSSVEDELEV